MDDMVIVSPDAGRWVTLPTGERIFVLNSPPDGVAPPPRIVLEPPAATTRAAPPAIELRSEEIEEIVGWVPGRLMRWGSAAIAAVVAGMLVLSFIVEYPEVARGRAVLTSPKPPVRLVARGGGEVEYVLARENDMVGAGAYVVVFKSSADLHDVQRISAQLERIEHEIGDGQLPLDTDVPLVAAGGDVQASYSALRQAVAEARGLEARDAFAAKLALLQQEAESYRQMRATLVTQQALLEQDRVIGDRQRDRARELAARKMMSEVDLDRAQADYLQKAQAVESGRHAQAENDVRIAQTEREALDLRRTQTEAELRQRLAIRTSVDAAREAVRRWEQQYVLRAPTSGRVSFIRAIAKGTYVGASESIVAVVPPEGAMTAAVTLTQADVGRVRVGQRVILRCDAFRPEEFGVLIGRVDRISLVANQRDVEGDRSPAYIVSVSLPRGTVTTEGKQLPLGQEALATADIVTEDLRVIDRIFIQFRAATARR